MDTPGHVLQKSVVQPECFVDIHTLVSYHTIHQTMQRCVSCNGVHCFRASGGLYLSLLSRVLPVLPMSLYCSMDCYCSPVNVCWLRFTIKYAGVPSSQTSLWASFIPLPLISPHRLLALLPWELPWRWDLLTAHSSIGHFSLSHDADFENCCRYWSLVDKLMVVLNMHHVLDLCYHVRQISSTVSGCSWIVFAVAPRKLAT